MLFYYHLVTYRRLLKEQLRLPSTMQASYPGTKPVVISWQQAFGQMDLAVNACRHAAANGENIPKRFGVHAHSIFNAQEKYLAHISVSLPRIFLFCHHLSAILSALPVPFVHLTTTPGSKDSSAGVEAFHFESSRLTLTKDDSVRSICDMHRSRM